ncbi:MAG: 23S rRNA (uracil(1939)-C(5))-methyltransferase RlmD [Woeseiaceae bacterium]|nr:23S rRNA (uracil(1939)-C(5))-methyltransferase RlmD [Gammaproteobacteria bacterium]NNK24694.1 23S rRNA (uracil(1939)-C(5))-methyltransferase RlmD [Woeseiaceae bacterium]
MARRKRREPETAAIVAATHDGRGIADTDGKKVFVAGALEGETVTFVRRKSRRNFDEAELLEIHEPSADRIEARCEAYGRCGGCSLQHVSAAHQREIKEGTLRDNLERIGRVEPVAWLPAMTGPEWHYRRRARLAVKDVRGKGRALVGFRERHAPFITDMRRCEVLVTPLDALIDDLSDLVGRLSIRARLPQIELAVAENAIALVFRVLDPPSEADEAEFRDFGNKHDLRIYLQPGGLDSLRLLQPAQVDEALYYTLPEFDIRIEFEPVDFVQINADINRSMVHFAVEQLGARGEDRVLDLYCGIGNFSLPLARQAASVVGVEGEESLTRRAAENARRNGIDNASFRVCDLGGIDGTEAWVREGCDRMLLDPARSGAAEVVEHMEKFDPARIVYVSCHPGTLARDAGALVHEKGYRLESAGIIDMFPHTAHVESIAVFARS